MDCKFYIRTSPYFCSDGKVLVKATFEDNATDEMVESDDNDFLTRDDGEFKLGPKSQAINFGIVRAREMCTKIMSVTHYEGIETDINQDNYGEAHKRLSKIIDILMKAPKPKI